MFGRPGLLARTDYLVEGPHRLTAFVAAEKESGGEGQPLCMRTTDGGERVGGVFERVLDGVSRDEERGRDAQEGWFRKTGRGQELVVVVFFEITAETEWEILRGEESKLYRCVLFRRGVCPGRWISHHRSAYRFAVSQTETSLQAERTRRVHRRRRATVRGRIVAHVVR